MEQLLKLELLSKQLFEINNGGIQSTMKKNLTVILYYAASVCFYIAAIIGFMNDNSMATVGFCLGSAMLCLGSAKLRKTRSRKRIDGAN